VKVVPEEHQVLEDLVALEAKNIRVVGSILKDGFENHVNYFSYPSRILIKEAVSCFCKQRRQPSTLIINYGCKTSLAITIF
jgi:hypothetical protein